MNIELSKETWKFVFGFEGFYEVSKNSLVRSIDRKIITPTGTRMIKGKLLKRRLNNRGYVDVRLSKNGETFTKLVHILSATAFVPNPFNKPEVNHLDGNKLNNNYTNFAWATHAENVQHAYDNGLCNLSTRQTPVIDICSDTTFPSIKKAAEFYDLKYATCKGYLNGTRTNPTCLRYLQVSTNAA